jgi:hypothetical protein
LDIAATKTGEGMPRQGHPEATIVDSNGTPTNGLVQDRGGFVPEAELPLLVEDAGGRMFVIAHLPPPSKTGRAVVERCDRRFRTGPGVMRFDG